MNKRQIEVQKTMLSQEVSLLDELKKIYKKASQDCDEQIRYLSTRSDMENAQSVVYQKKYQQAIKKQIDTALTNLDNNLYTSLDDYLTNAYDTGFIGTLYDLQGQGIPLCFPIEQDQVVQAIQLDSKISEGLYTRLGEDVSSLKKSISSAISNSIASGLSWNKAAELIANGMNSPFNKAYNNSVRIARTEGHRIQQQATYNCQQKAKSKGADVVKQWDSTLDSSTRATHKELDGQIQELDKPFKVAGKQALYPGEFGDPSEDCNCRCCLLQRAKWAISKEEYVTKFNGDINELVTIKSDSYAKFEEEYRQVVSNGLYSSDDGGIIEVNKNNPITQYRNFDIDNQSEYTEWETAYYKKNNLNITDADKEYIKIYSDGSFEAINGVERFAQNSAEYDAICHKYRVDNLNKYKEQSDKISLAISKFELDEDIVTHRYVRNVDYITGIDSTVDSIVGSIGNQYEEKGFTSSCIFDKLTKHFGGQNPIHIEIKVPKNSKGAYINEFSEKKNTEFEFLLDKNTQFKITDGGERTIQVKKFDYKERKWMSVEDKEKYLTLEVVK